MENEKRLIDANALKSEFEWLKSVVNESSKDEVMDVMQRIDNAPTVDAVEVVRCKDCKHRKEWLKEGTFYCCNPDYGMASGVELEDNDFCSYGERREKDAVD